MVINYFNKTFLPLFAITTTFIVQYPTQLAQSSQQDIGRIAETTTVMIDGQNQGSGVIIEKKGDTYSVLTAKHVVATPDEYDIVTPDGNIYALDYNNVEKINNIDLAIAHFNSNNNYPIAKLGNSEQISLGNKVYIAGWPHPEAPINQNLFVLTEGNIAALAPRPLPEGYQLVYTNLTKVGMSGGPVFNEKGELVGIHGQAQGRRVYLENYDKIDLKSGFNIGIPLKALYTENQSIQAELPQISPNTVNQPSQISTNINNNEIQQYWSKSPRLIDSATTQDGTRIRSATYYFTVSIPEDAGAPLEQLTFAQTQWADFWETYKIEETKAFEGTRQNRGKTVSLGLVSIDDDNETVTVTFDPPISAGKTVTVGLRPFSTPSNGGVYQFRVTAFPPGGKSRSLSLGVARLHFYDRRRF